ncbi:MAG: hypothetical protein E7328_06545 [Clostridiales bacterium]|nr:hypothetical protein [Clostridiales bacterium]
MLFDNPMLLGILALMILPIVATVLWLVKKVLKLSFSVGKILLLLFALWFVFTAVTGGLSDVFSNIGKANITQKDGELTYISAFSGTELDLDEYMEHNETFSINTAFGSVTLRIPENTVVRIKAQGFGIQLIEGEEKETIFFGEKQIVVGNGSVFRDITLNGGFMTLNIETAV